VNELENALFDFSPLCTFQVLANVLNKLKIENAVWSAGKNNNFYQVMSNADVADSS
jgi:hypothetical protein